MKRRIIIIINLIFIIAFGLVIFFMPKYFIKKQQAREQSMFQQLKDNVEVDSAQNSETEPNADTKWNVGTKLEEEVQTNETEADSNAKSNGADIGTVSAESRYYGGIATLEIPKIKLKEKILGEYNESNLRKSITKFFGANPNEVGNFCVSGHNYKINGNDMFKNLNKLKESDKVYITDLKGNTIEYNVYSILKVLPNETKSLSQKTDGKREVTLITCTADSKKRIIVKACSKKN